MGENDIAAEWLNNAMRMRKEIHDKMRVQTNRANKCKKIEPEKAKSKADRHIDK